jgi:hypothetical protein
MSMPVIPLGVIGLLAVMYMLYIFANLSQRLGAVTKMAPYYRGFYVAMGLMGVSVFVRIVFSGFGLTVAPFVVLAAYHLPFLMAMLVSIVIAWRYWSWLFKEKLQ